MTSAQKPIRKSYANVLATLQAKVDQLQADYGFDPGNGWVQVRDADIPRIVAYGEFDGLRRMIERLDCGYLVEAAR